MKAIKIIGVYFAIALIFFQCEENELTVTQSEVTPDFPVSAQSAISQYQTGSLYYVTTSGNDASGDGSVGNPWKTLRYAVTRVPANQGHTIMLSAGTFIESGLTEVPLGVNIEGAGKDQTIIRAASSFYYYPASPSYATDKFLISLNGFNQANGNQVLKKFTIEGDAKKLHAGIYVHYRSNVIIDEVKVQNTNFTGIWLWDVKDTQITNTDLVNCSWGSSGWCAGALNLGNLERVDIANLNVNESTGYGIKAIGPSGYNNIFQLKIHDSRISVHPFGLWNGGSAPNIAIELWGVNLVGCEIYNTYVDNTISLINSNAIPSTGVQSIRVHHNTLDMETRASGAGYGVELTVHDAEIDHNYFLKGTYGIANWDNPMRNWSIHHNVFYAMQGTYPGEAVRSQWSGLHNVKFYNNTVEFTGNRTMNVIGMYGGTSENVELKNNLIINSNTGYNYYTNQLIHRENGAVLNNLQVTNNILRSLDLNVGGLIGGLLGLLDPILNNSTADPQITRSGVRPDPYYIPLAGSPLINAGVNVGFPYQGSAPDIGALETGGPANLAPQVTLTSPANNSTFTAGSSVTLTANATDSDGTLPKVEFFNGATKLGESLSAPYSFTWSNVEAGSYSLTAKTTDNSGAATTSSAVNITVSGANNAPSISITSPVNNASFTSGSSVTIAVTASDSDGSVSKVEFFNGSTKLGEDLESPYSFAWSNVQAGSYSLSAKATDNSGAATTSGVINISVSGDNNAPTVSLISPANNSIFAPGATIGLSANASDTGGSISKVEFFNGSTKLGEDLWAPHNFAWINVPAGSYSLTAKATDNLGAVKTSTAIAITVVTNIPPSVSLTSPANNSSFLAGSRITITANASDSDGILKVEFFRGSVKLGEDVTYPYYFHWNNVPAGSYGVSARATDRKGGIGNSSTRNITVTASSNSAPAVSLTSPVNNSSFAPGTSIMIIGNATDNDGTITKVEFYSNAVKIGEDLTAPYSVVLTAPASGSLALTAKATDNLGAATTSASVTATVNAQTFVQINLDASQATLTGQMTLGSDAQVGSYFSVPAGNGKNYYIPPSAAASYSFQVSKTDSYVMWVRVKAPTVNNQSYHVYDGMGRWTTWSAGIQTQWTWVKVTDAYTGGVVPFAFSQGTHNIQFGWLDDNVQVDQLIITNDPNYSPN